LTEIPNTPQRHTKLVALILLLLAVAMLGTALVVHLVQAGRYEALSSAEETTLNYAKILETRVSARHRRSHAVFATMAQSAGPEVFEPGAALRHAARLTQMMDTQLINFSEVSSARLIDLSGNVRYSSGERPKAVVNVADRAWFQEVRSAPHGATVMSEVLVGRISGEPIFVLARNLRGKDGVAYGIGVLTISLKTLQNQFHELATGSGGSVAMWRTDNYALQLRWPDRPQEVNKPLTPGKINIKMLETGQKAFNFQIVSQVDGVRRIFGLQRSDVAPFYISVGFSEADVLGKWQQQALAISVLGSGLWLLLLGLLRGLWLAETARTKAQINLAESEARWRFATEGVGDAVWDKNLGSGEVFFSPRWSQMLGYEPGEVRNASDEWTSRIHRDDAVRVRVELQRHLTGLTQAYVCEYRLRCKDGSYKWILARGLVVSRDAQGKPLRLVGTHSDISARKASQEQLRTTNALLEYSQAATKLGGWELDLESGHLFWTAEAYRIHETTPEEFNPTVEAGLGYLLPESRERVSKALQEAMEQGLGFDLELETLTTKGRRIDVRTTCTVTLQGGKPAKLTGIFQDITEHKQRQTHLRLMEAAVAKLNDIVLITEAEPQSEPGPRIVFANQAFERRTGYTVQEVIGLTPRILQGPKTQRTELDRIGAAMKNWEPVRGELINYTKAGEEFWIELEIVPLANETGWFTHWVSVERDITQRKTAELALTHANQELRRSNAELEQFAYVASHDLQEPLRSISSCVQLLQKRYQGQLDARADEFIAHAVSGSKRMQQLIDDLLDFSRISMAPQALSMVNLQSTLAGVQANLARSIAASSATITHDVLPSVMAMPGQLSQLLQNLIGNAIKFRGDKPAVVHVGVHKEGNFYVFSVADQGIGIAPQYFERVFKLFQRLHSRDEYDGTGIGLTICQKIVERHGGRIWLESEPGKGCTFFFTLKDASGEHAA
jgi:PAS domain S-box-containing protein